MLIKLLIFLFFRIPLGQAIEPIQYKFDDFLSYYPQVGSYRNYEVLKDLGIRPCPKTAEEWGKLKKDFAHAYTGVQFATDTLFIRHRLAFYNRCPEVKNKCLAHFVRFDESALAYNIERKKAASFAELEESVPLSLRSPDFFKFFKEQRSIQQVLNFIKSLQPPKETWEVTNNTAQILPFGSLMDNAPIVKSKEVDGRVLIGVKKVPPVFIAIPYHPVKDPKNEDLMTPRSWHNNLSIVTYMMGASGEYFPVFHDFKIPVSSGEVHGRRLTSSALDVSCYQCHVNGPIPFGYKPRHAHQEQFGSQRKLINSWMGHTPTALSRHLNGLGPNIGDNKERSPKFVLSCLDDLKNSVLYQNPAAKKQVDDILEDVQRRNRSARSLYASMNCSSCHGSGEGSIGIKMLHLGQYNGLNTKNVMGLFATYIHSGYMPILNKFPLNEVERVALTHCLVKEFYGERGLWDKWRNQGQCGAEQSSKEILVDDDGVRVEL